MANLQSQLDVLAKALVSEYLHNKNNNIRINQNVDTIDIHVNTEDSSAIRRYTDVKTYIRPTFELQKEGIINTYLFGYNDDTRFGGFLILEESDTQYDFYVIKENGGIEVIKNEIEIKENDDIEKIKNEIESNIELNDFIADNTYVRTFKLDDKESESSQTEKNKNRVIYVGSSAEATTITIKVDNQDTQFKFNIITKKIVEDDINFEIVENNGIYYVYMPVNDIKICVWAYINLLTDRTLLEETTMNEIYIGADITHIKESLFKDCVNLKRINVSPQNNNFKNLSDYSAIVSFERKEEKDEKGEIVKKKYLKDLIAYAIGIEDTDYDVIEKLKDVNGELKDINGELEGIKNYAFRNAKNLDTLIIHKKHNINDTTFYDCDNLSLIRIDNNVRDLNYENDIYKKFENKTLLIEWVDAGKFDFEAIKTIEGGGTETTTITGTYDINTNRVTSLDDDSFKKYAACVYEKFTVINKEGLKEDIEIIVGLTKDLTELSIVYKSTNFQPNYEKVVKGDGGHINTISLGDGETEICFSIIKDGNILHKCQKLYLFATKTKDNKTLEFDCAGDTKKSYTIAKVIDGIPEGGATVPESLFKGFYNLKQIIFDTTITVINGPLIDATTNNTKQLSAVLLSENITQIQKRSFYGCHNLKKIIIPKNINYIDEYAFYDCDNIKDFVIPTSIRTLASNCFNNCQSIKNLCFVNENIDLDTIDIYNGAFSNCAYLNNVYIKSNKIKLTGAPFETCSKLKYVYINFKTLIVDSVSFSDRNAEKIVIDVKDGKLSNEQSLVLDIRLRADFFVVNNEKLFWLLKTGEIAKNIIYKYSEGMCVHFLDHDKSEQEYDIYYKNKDNSVMFGYFKDISFEINMNDKNLKYISNSAYSVEFETPNAESVNIYIKDSGNNIIWAYIEDIKKSKIFKDNKLASNLLKVVFNDNEGKIPKGAFENCEKLTEFESLVNISSVEERAFYNCKSLYWFTVPTASGTSDETSGGISIENEAFYNCTSMCFFDVAFTSVGEKAFYNCTSLTIINLSEECKSIGDKAFFNCVSLDKVDLNNITTIGYKAFFNCCNLTVENYNNKLETTPIDAFIGVPYIIKSGDDAIE